MGCWKGLERMFLEGDEFVLGVGLGLGVGGVIVIVLFLLSVFSVI